MSNKKKSEIEYTGVDAILHEMHAKKKSNKRKVLFSVGVTGLVLIAIPAIMFANYIANYNKVDTRPVKEFVDAAKGDIFVDPTGDSTNIWADGNVEEHPSVNNELALAMKQLNNYFNSDLKKQSIYAADIKTLKLFRNDQVDTTNLSDEEKAEQESTFIDVIVGNKTRKFCIRYNTIGIDEEIKTNQGDVNTINSLMSYLQFTGIESITQMTSTDNKIMSRIPNAQYVGPAYEYIMKGGFVQYRIPVYCSDNGNTTCTTYSISASTIDNNELNLEDTLLKTLCGEKVEVIGGEATFTVATSSQDQDLVAVQDILDEQNNTTQESNSDVIATPTSSNAYNNNYLSKKDKAYARNMVRNPYAGRNNYNNNFTMSH